MDDWRRVPLGDVFDVQLGKMLSAGTEHGDQFPYLANRNVQWGQIVIDELGTMNFSALERERYRLKSGDLLVCEGGEVGRAALWSDQLPECYFQNALHRLRATPGADSRFMRHYIEFAALTGSLRALTGQTSIGHLPRSNLVRWLVSLPPLEEQRRIAEVLDTIDENIRATERVISKYRSIRTGLTSDLLNGESRGMSTGSLSADETLRPPGSAGGSRRSANSGWTYRRLADVGVVVGGGTPSRERPEYWDGTIPWLTPGEITSSRKQYISDTQDYITEHGLSASGARLLPECTLLMTSRASLGSCVLAGRSMATNQGFKNLIPGSGVDPSYLFYLGRTLSREMTRRASGTTFLEISGREFGRIEICVPPLEEQRRIAEILDTVDDTIHVDERRLDKLRQLRVGLAADLLSGRVRTVTP